MVDSMWAKVVLSLNAVLYLPYNIIFHSVLFLSCFCNLTEEEKEMPVTNTDYKCTEKKKNQYFCFEKMQEKYFGRNCTIKIFILFLQDSHTLSSGKPTCVYSLGPCRSLAWQQVNLPCRLGNAQCLKSSTRH